MSELYIVLRNRLAVVKDWVPIGQKRMREARVRKGLSYEAMGRILHISSKTWDRWEKRGAVPVHDLDRVADVLGLEVERYEGGTPIRIDRDRLEEEAEQIATHARTIATESAALAQTLGELRELLQQALQEARRAQDGQL